MRTLHYVNKIILLGSTLLWDVVPVLSRGNNQINRDFSLKIVLNQQLNEKPVKINDYLSKLVLVMMYKS